MTNQKIHEIDEEIEIIVSINTNYQRFVMGDFAS